jgi:hypothetical protein
MIKNSMCESKAMMRESHTEHDKSDSILQSFCLFYFGFGHQNRKPFRETRNGRQLGDNFLLVLFYFTLIMLITPEVVPYVPVN